MTSILLGPRDPILLRDARGFDAEPGARAFTLPWPLPRTVAGAIRTHIGNHALPYPFDWSKDGPDQARSILVHGPLLIARKSLDDPWNIFVAAPRDHVALKPGSDKDFMCLRPWREELPAAAGTWWDDATDKLRPLRVDADGKPDSAAPAFWSLKDVWSWLTSVSEQETRALSRPQEGLAALLKDTHAHVSMDAATGTGAEGMLFSVESLVFPDIPIDGAPGSLWTAAGSDVPELRILARVDTNTTWTSEVTWSPLGGERRLSTIERNALSWPAPPELKSFPKEAQGIRLLLATPAIFEGGWKPGWVDETGVPPGCDLGGARLRLVSAAIDRPIPVSGWDLAARQANATTYAARAGSVYFFTVTDLGTQTVENVFERIREQLWLRPVSDHEQHRNEGFGLVLPGLW